jgi:hypothetical protein
LIRYFCKCSGNLNIGTGATLASNVIPLIGFFTTLPHIVQRTFEGVFSSTGAIVGSGVFSSFFSLFTTVGTAVSFCFLFQAVCHFWNVIFYNKDIN